MIGTIIMALLSFSIGVLFGFFVTALCVAAGKGNDMEEDAWEN